MNVGIFLAIGESFEDFVLKGQADLLVRQNIGGYSKAFDHVYVFSYGKLKIPVPPNVTILPNVYGIHRYLYCFLLPFFYRKEIISCGALRGLQLSGGIPGLIANLIFKKKYIINYGYRYSHVASKEGKNFQALFYHLVEAIVLYFAAAVIVTTKQLEHAVRRKSKKTILIPNGIDIDIFKPTKKNKKYKQIIYVGRLEKIKNIENLIIAISKLKEKYTLKIIGTGSLKENLCALAQTVKIKLIILYGIRNQDIANYLNESEIFVLPSLEEGHPKALLEAMACALPVIGTNVEGTKDSIVHNQTGLLCGTSSIDLYHAITKLTDNKELQKKIGRNAREYIERNFSHKPLMEKEIELINSVSH